MSRLIRLQTISVLSLVLIEMATGQSPPPKAPKPTDLSEQDAISTGKNRGDRQFPANSTRPSSLTGPIVTDHASANIVNGPATSADTILETSADQDWKTMGIPLQSDGQVVAVYQDKLLPYEDRKSPWYDRSGFIHPMRTPSGRIVTDPFSPDHAHQHAIMFAWTSSAINGRKVDFWNSHRKQGHVEHARLINHDKSSLETLLNHVDDTADSPAVTLREHWRLKTIPHPSVHVLDFESTQIKTTDAAFTIRQYHYGGLCVRGAAQWREKVDMITSEGKSISDGNHTQPRWVAMFGKVDGHICGIAAMNHPTNFRYPQHARLHPTMPYFSFFPAVDASFEIRSDEPYRSRFRFVTFDGQPDADLLNELCDAFDQKSFEINTADNALGIR